MALKGSWKGWISRVFMVGNKATKVEIKRGVSKCMQQGSELEPLCMQLHESIHHSEY